MVDLREYSNDGKSNSFGKDKLLENVIHPEIVKTAKRAGLDPEKFVADQEMQEEYYRRPFASVMDDGNEFVPEYNYVLANVHFRIILSVNLSDPVNYRNAIAHVSSQLYAKNLQTGQCYYFAKNGVWKAMPGGMF